MLKVLNINLEKKVEEAVAEIREKENMLIAQSRLATMGEMIGNIAHQWRQPLTAVGIIVQNYEDDYEAGILDMKYLEEHSDKVMDILQEMSRTIDDFRNFFKPNKLIKEFNIKSIIEKTISFVKASFRLNSIKLELNLKDTCYIEGFPNEYSQVILNILNNAKEVIKERNIQIENRKIIINLYKEDGKSVVTIADTGKGIPEDIIGRIFEPYFTTKDDETGTGLGLYMSKTIIEENMKGKLTARNIKDGAEFKIEI